MIDQFPDSSLVPRAKQKLREVQEVMGEREFLIGQYYASRLNWAGTIARLQTVADTYPLYSKSDELWITIGDAYAGEAHPFRPPRRFPELSVSVWKLSISTKPPQLTAESSPAIPWLPALKMHGIALSP
jgi:hypothetical protein